MFMHRIKLQNILSFGPEAQELELAPLNVLIGPNGSGKSNLLEVIGLLRAAPTDITDPIREGGGEENWLWRGAPTVAGSQVEVTVEPSFALDDAPVLRYSLAMAPGMFGIMDFAEEIAEDPQHNNGNGRPVRYLQRGTGSDILTLRDVNGKKSRHKLSPMDVDPSQSMLSQLQDPLQYREVTSLGYGLAAIRMYREWSFGRDAPPRLEQRANLPDQFLLEDASNLGMVLRRLEDDHEAKTKLLTALRRLYHGIDDYHVQVEAGSVQVILREGNFPIPAARLSDGTLRYLCLLAILCTPTPPPLICVELPELGLHPDVLPGLADLLREASERCQLIVTTHSDVLVDALTETIDSIVVCEKEDGQTRLKRMDADDLSHWLQDHRLGELWTSGELGGTRW